MASLGGVLLPTAAGCVPGPPADSLTVAGGEAGGLYLEFAALLASSLQRHGVAKKASALETGGSLENMDRLARGEATLAIALSDAASDRLGGDTPSSAPSAAGGARMLALGKVYENYLHCVVRKDSGILSVADLAGKAVAVGDPGSGTSLTARRLLEVAGMSAAAPSPTTPGTLPAFQLGLNRGLAALRDGSVEALFWSGGVPTAAIAAFAKSTKLQLLDLSPLIPTMKARFGSFYERVLIQENSYDGIPATWTVGVANLLLCRADLDRDVARSTVEILLQHSAELVPSSSRGVQYLSPETLIGTAGVPLHPGAEDAYRAFHG
ncbi:TAXI family TRAP transporter solute-binding subunit [Sinomonas terrae]|uniref:TAXI family TRAP transporter solute-binding subunit n=1 Tax=Sinomonas terrae TaxID=2908838 RepID=A0ABS9U493_9MICC|nr:TAXI family TRAP transporter solute-binding subunit [Sinomonas terrae]MCH6471509.1 TAXI family TRAP transporter solute-binding subunit [Sinomonas terrae]